MHFAILMLNNSYFLQNINPFVFVIEPKRVICEAGSCICVTMSLDSSCICVTMSLDSLHDGAETLHVSTVCLTWRGQARVNAARQQPDRPDASLSHCGAIRLEPHCARWCMCHLPAPRYAAYYVTDEVEWNSVITS